MTADTNEAQKALAKQLCFSDCSQGKHLDYGAGCCSVCKSPDECQGWMPYLNTAGTNEALDALAYRFWSVSPRDLDVWERTAPRMPEGYPGGVRAWFYACEMRDMLTAQAAKLAEAEAAAEGALMILMDERAHADRLAEALKPFADCVQRSNLGATLDTSQLRWSQWMDAHAALASYQKRRAG